MAKRAVEAVTTEKSELQLILRNCEEDAEAKKTLEAQLERTRQEMDKQKAELENQKTTTMKLTKEKEGIERQLKFQGKII